MTLREYARLLRRVADDLEVLLAQAAPVARKNETKETAARIVKAARKGPTRDYKGKHWTQRPENRKRLVAMLKARAAARKAAAKEANGGSSATAH